MLFLLFFFVFIALIFIIIIVFIADSLLTNRIKLLRNEKVNFLEMVKKMHKVIEVDYLMIAF